MGEKATPNHKIPFTVDETFHESDNISLAALVHLLKLCRDEKIDINSNATILTVNLPLKILAANSLIFFLHV